MPRLRINNFFKERPMKSAIQFTLSIVMMLTYSISATAQDANPNTAIRTPPRVSSIESVNSAFTNGGWLSMTWHGSPRVLGDFMESFADSSTLSGHEKGYLRGIANNLRNFENRLVANMAMVPALAQEAGQPINMVFDN